jgi:hypothetical protein
VPDSPNEAQRTAIITTEHFTLQTARSAAITHANGRLAAFLGSVSSSLIACARGPDRRGRHRFPCVRFLAARAPRFTRDRHVRADASARHRGHRLRTKNQHSATVLLSPRSGTGRLLDDPRRRPRSEQCDPTGRSSVLPFPVAAVLDQRVGGSHHQQLPERGPGWFCRGGRGGPTSSRS